MSQIANIVKLIEDNNVCTFTLPESKREVNFKRYDVASLNNINNIFNKSDGNEILIDYYNYLIDLIKKRTTEDLSYIDFLYSILYIRYNENDTYNDISLKEAVESIPEKISEVIIPDSLKISDNKIDYQINFELPNMSKLSKLLRICKKDSSDILFYSIFKFVKDIIIEVGEQSTEANTIEDLRSIYNVISYKALDRINDTTNNITDKLYNLYNVNIETDTGFLIST